MDLENKGDGAPSLGQTTDNEYFAQSGASIYAYKRQRRDSAWTVAYCLLAALTVFWGIAAFAHTNEDIGEYSLSFYYNSTTCDLKSFQAAHPVSEDLEDDDVEADMSFMPAFKKHVSIWLPITAAVSICSAVVYIALFRRYAKAMVTATIVCSLATSACFGIISIIAGAIGFGIFLIIVTAISALFYWWIRAQLRMCADLLAVSGRGLNENLGLVPAAVGTKIAGLCVLIYSAAALFSALNIGTAKHSGAVVTRLTNPAAAEEAICLDAIGNRIACCEFATAGWASAYAFFAACFISWTSMLIMQIKLYTVADTIAQWYFSASAGGSSAPRLTSGSVRLALRNCLTHSFGSVAFAAAILAVLRAIRRSLEQSARKNIICCIINCIAQPLLAMMEKFTRFSTIAVAITGQAFVPAAKDMFDILKRNFLQTYSLWWVPDMVLSTSVSLFSFSWAAIVYFTTWGATKRSGPEVAIPTAIFVSLVCFLCMFFVLLFVAGLLLDVVNTLYICYALDKDQRRVTHPEIHAIYNMVPGIQGSVVENPDGAVMYGAPDAQPQQQQQQAPPPYPGYAPVAGAYPAVYPPAPVVQPPPAGYGYPVQQYPGQQYPTDRV